MQGLDSYKFYQIEPEIDQNRNRYYGSFQYHNIIFILYLSYFSCLDKMGHGVGGKGIIARLGRANFEVNIIVKKSQQYIMTSYSTLQELWRKNATPIGVHIGHCPIYKFTPLVLFEHHMFLQVMHLSFCKDNKIEHISLHHTLYLIM